MDDQTSSLPEGSPSEPRGTIDGHVTPERIADAHAGLATMQDARAVAIHLASCSECAAVAADIDAVAQRLAAAPPDVIPESVSRALQATITAEVARRESLQRKARHTTAGTTWGGTDASSPDAVPRKQDLWNGSRSTVDR